STRAGGNPASRHSGRRLPRTDTPGAARFGSRSGTSESILRASIAHVPGRSIAPASAAKIETLEPATPDDPPLLDAVPRKAPPSTLPDSIPSVPEAHLSP